uniref:Endoplasmic reticulum oxidoreductin 1 n=1 Tax=Physcomitrium patens TaxID=3218 RepID=A0A7I4DWF4_PHYPA
MAENNTVDVTKRKSHGRWLSCVYCLLVLSVAVAVRFFSQPLPFQVLQPQIARHSSDSCECERNQQFQGVVKDCCCDYGTVDLLNKEVLHPLLQELVRTPFFRYYKVKLWCDCEFWPNDGMCQLRDCSVCECPESEFPAAFRSSGHASCQEGTPEGAVDRTVDAKAFQGWTDSDNPWTVDDETESEDMTLISGLHTSISTHIAADYLVDESVNAWGKNVALMHERVLQHPERVQNLYFTYLFVLRAVIKAEAYLSEAEYLTGNDSEDNLTHKLVAALVGNERLRTACPIPFDEAKMWRGPDAIELKEQLQSHFRNISALMDCVGCEKCRLWGKLQISGLGTALKILFSLDGETSAGNVIDLQRNEVIALMNLLSRLSESLELVHEMADVVKGHNKLSTSVDGVSTVPNQSKSSWWFLQEDDKPPKSLPSLFQNFGF